MNGRFVLSALSSGVLTVALLGLGWQLSTPGHDRAVTYLIGVLGVVLGWPAGIMVSPHDTKEEQTFSGAAKVVSGFVTGFLVSKIDRLWDDAMQGVWITRPVLLTRLGYGLACFILSAVTVFFVRSYKP